MSDLPAGVELRTAGPNDRDAVVTLLHERMSSRIGLARWRRLFDYPWLADKPDCGVVVLEQGRVAGYLAVIYADRRLGGRTVRTANLSSWYLVRQLRGQGVGLAMLQLATRDPAVTYTTFSSNPPALRVMAKAGLVLLDDSRFLWRRTGAHAAGVAVLSGFEALLPEVPDHEGRILVDHRDLPVQPHLLRAAEGDCLIVLSIKRKGADVAYHEVLHLGRPAIFARHAAAFANAVLTPGAAVLAVDRRFLDGCEVVAESEPISVPRYFRSPDLARREVDFLYSEIPLLDLKLY
jgi:RimJ/RimL family protein N-acetyltransferase